MDWGTFPTSLVTSLGGIVVLVLVWVGKNWLRTRIKESVEHKYSTKLEDHKARLQQQTTAAVKRTEADLQETMDRQAADEELLRRLLTVLPSSGSISFLKENNFAGFSFSRTSLSQLSTFVHEWDNVEHEFLDIELERQRRALLVVSNQFLTYLNINTFSVKSGGRYGVPEEWEHEQPQRFHETVEKIHELAASVVNCHTALVRTGRGKLKLRARQEPAEAGK